MFLLSFLFETYFRGQSSGLLFALRFIYCGIHELFILDICVCVYLKFVQIFFFSFHQLITKVVFIHINKNIVCTVCVNC